MSIRNSSYYEADWNATASVIDYLYARSGADQANTTVVQQDVASQGYGERLVRDLLNKLDNQGIIMSRRVPHSNAYIWCHVAKYDPDEVEE